ncbi:Peptidyl-prolyl cis-trans isomerase [Penicillium oxalicum]|uniref:Peptidyl-prolyl cis-trans isomerase n=1 Tax=Penicillium oxalicum TaxID=69781 RepID=UPI0020B7CC92|nr:Peptidyl-prolyl cis-trans isomerase [Penicillium oxalicum]KAI2792218.1 Peptidyl-prolyl cis-trans isomerase [Penicillium oxalicum]
MGVEKTVLKAGNGVDFPQKGDNVAMHYTGCLYDASAAANHYMGQKFDSSRDRGTPLASPIGVGRLIKGWDEGVPQMSLGERAILDISPGFPGLIPPNSRLVFDVELVKINNKTA